MSLTEEQIKLVQSSWDVVKSKGDFETHGLTLFERLFTSHPAMYGVFPFAKGYGSWPELSGTARMKRHATGVIKAVDGAVGGLNDLSAVAPALTTLGGKHAKHPIKPEYFGAVGDALLFTLERGLGDQWNAETKEAWTAVYGIVATVMQKGLEEAKK